MRCPGLFAPACGFGLRNVLFAKGKNEKITGVGSIGTQVQTHSQGRTAHFLVQPLIVDTSYPHLLLRRLSPEWGFVSISSEAPVTFTAFWRMGVVWDLRFALIKTETLELKSCSCSITRRTKYGQQALCNTPGTQQGAKSVEFITQCPDARVPYWGMCLAT